jgi:glycosyltransferase involved in cell wall biosynthesis
VESPHYAHYVENGLDVGGHVRARILEADGRLPMKIGFDTSQTGRAKAGCGHFADGVIRQLAADDDRNSYILYPALGDFFWDPDFATGTFASDRPGFERWKAPADFEASRRFWCNPGEDFEHKLGNPDIFHSNNFFCPRGLKNARLVYTLYDLSFIEDPSWNTEENRIGCFSGVFRAGLYADLIVAISEYTRRHFLSTFPWFPPERVTVVYPASRFSVPREAQCPDNFAALRPGGFWLSVGTIEPRKNYGRLLDAYRILKAGDGSTLPLVLAGGKGWLVKNFDTFLHGLEPGREVILPGYVSDDEMRWLYRNCFGFLYPSLFEGFGMPVLEALGFGAPVLCSNTSSLPEAAGDAALFFDPLNTCEIAAAMRRLASGGISRDAFRTAALHQAAKFSWAGSAARLRELYDHVMTLARAGDGAAEGGRGSTALV